MPILRIAQAQVSLRVGDLAGNAETIISHMKRARDAGADLVSFPELAITGYPPEDLLLKPRFLEDAANTLQTVAQAAQGITAVVGCATNEGGKVFNSAAVLSRGELAGVYHKIELPNYGVFDEARYFEPGREYHVLEMNGARLLLTVCEDIWVEDDPVERCAKDPGVQAVINISSSPFFAGKLALRHEIISGFAGRTGAYVFYNNMVGGQDELVFDGGSLVAGPNGAGGVVLSQAARFSEDLLVYDLELPQAPAMSSDQPVQVTSIDSQVKGGKDEAAPKQEPAMDLVEEVYHALVLGTRDYLAKTGFKKAVLGLSGGIDSALTAAIAVDALGKENVAGVTMPSQYTSQGTLGDAGALARNLDIKLYTAPIKGILDSYVAQLTDDLGGPDLGVTAENLQARIRGNILMAFSNRYGWLVLTTGNKSELAVGYCTLYGDMAGGFAVIKDVPKTMVYKLSDFINQRAGREIIPVSTIQRAPSAELRPDQIDQDSLPPYEVLDPILKAYVEEDKVLDEIVELGFEPDMVKEVVRLVDLNEYKRRQAPPGVKITPKAFGKDRRLPICNFYRPGWS
jgi:NAD+ synthase (glutamine-hydrolysing)